MSTDIIAAPAILALPVAILVVYAVLSLLSLLSLMVAHHRRDIGIRIAFFASGPTVRGHLLPRTSSVVAALLVVQPHVASGQITSAGQPAQLSIRRAGQQSIRVTLAPVDFPLDLPPNPALADRDYPAPALLVRDLREPVTIRVGELRVEVRPLPLTITVTKATGRRVQELVFEQDGTMSFSLDGAPLLGLGEGGPRPSRDSPWREQRVEFDRRGRLHAMEPRWQSDMYGSRSPVPMLFGTSGWGLFVAAPWVQVDLRGDDRGVMLPVVPDNAVGPQNRSNQQQVLGKGLPPASSYVPGLFDVFVFDAGDPQTALEDFSVITGPAAMPPKWALGYMQSHRTLEDEEQLLEIIDTFRRKSFPLDAVIYLGTGFSPRGWNTPQPSFDFNPDVFRRDPRVVIDDMHARNVKVVVHIVPWDRDRLATLHGTIPAGPDETVDASHIQRYWAEHNGLLEAGVDGFWPDEGDWFNLHERLKRHQMYYQGQLASRPNLRPWHLQRNGFAGIARWGGWVWSGDTQSAWKTLEAQIAVGLNYSLSLSPFWGSDIGGFYPSNEYTAELYVRWFQFAAFCASFRAHGRVWWMRLPWGWGMSDVGPREYGNRNEPIPPDDPRNILTSELNNPGIEPIVKRYAELRYQLMPYTYTLARQARDAGLPLMRAMWVHYPDDEQARALGTQYLWGRDLLVAPVYEESATTRDVYLPDGTWYDWWSGDTVAGGRSVTRPVDLSTMPIYVRAGAIIPVDPVRQYTGQRVDEPTTLTVYRGADGSFTLYDDDGATQEYVRGRGTWIRMQWHEDAARFVLAPGTPPDGVSLPVSRVFRVRILPDDVTRLVRYEGQLLDLQF